MKKQMKPLRKQAGVTLLEVLAYLGVAAMVLIGAVAMFRSAQGSSQVNDVMQQLSALRSNIKMINASQAGFGSATYPTTGNGTSAMNQVLINARAVPDTLRVNTTTWAITNAYNGNVNIDGSASDFWITYTGVSQEACIKIAPQIGAGWLGLRVNANAEQATDTAVFPLSLANTQCVAGNNNVMVFRGR